MKDKALVTFRRSASEEVIGEIVSEAGQIVSSRNFGVMSVEEYKRVLRLVELDNPDVDISPLIELTGN
jgi:hypothetical protein